MCTTELVKLAERFAWPAEPQDGYGLEKLYAEKIADSLLPRRLGFTTFTGPTENGMEVEKRRQQLSF